VIAALRAGGLLEKSDEGICALARASADLLDESLAYRDSKLYAISQMMRTHLVIVEALVGRAVTGHKDDAYSELIAALSTPLGWPGVGPMGDAIVEPTPRMVDGEERWD
jgi:hypothetical protein